MNSNDWNWLDDMPTYKPVMKIRPPIQMKPIDGGFAFPVVDKTYHGNAIKAGSIVDQHKTSFSGVNFDPLKNKELDDKKAKHNTLTYVVIGGVVLMVLMMHKNKN